MYMYTHMKNNYRYAFILVRSLTVWFKLNFLKSHYHHFVDEETKWLVDLER